MQYLWANSPVVTIPCNRIHIRPGHTGQRLRQNNANNIKRFKEKQNFFTWKTAMKYTCQQLSPVWCRSIKQGVSFFTHMLQKHQEVNLHEWQLWTCISWNSPIGRPNCSRCRIQGRTTSRHACISPRGPAAKASLSKSSPDIRSEHKLLLQKNNCCVVTSLQLFQKMLKNMHLESNYDIIYLFLPGPGHFLLEQNNFQR